MRLFLQINTCCLSRARAGRVSDPGILLCREIFIDDFIDWSRVRIFRPRKDAGVKKPLGSPSILHPRGSSSALQPLGTEDSRENPPCTPRPENGDFPGSNQTLWRAQAHRCRLSILGWCVPWRCVAAARPGASRERRGMGAGCCCQDDFSWFRAFPAGICRAAGSHVSRGCEAGGSPWAVPDPELGTGASPA